MKISRVLKKYPQLDAEILKLKMSNRFLVEETSKKIRQMTVRGEKDACYVCGKYREICHLHHLVPVEELTVLVMYFELHDENLYIPTVWLCPNHHAIYHYSLDSQHTIEHMTLEEQLKYEELGRMFNPARYKEMLASGKKDFATDFGGDHKDDQLILPIFDTVTSLSSWASTVERKSFMREQQMKDNFHIAAEAQIKATNDLCDNFPTAEDLQWFTPLDWKILQAIGEIAKAQVELCDRTLAGLDTLEIRNVLHSLLLKSARLIDARKRRLKTQHI